MGLSLEFYAGQADQVGAAFTNIEFDGLRDGSLAHSYADLSLHIGRLMSVEGGCGEAVKGA